MIKIKLPDGSVKEFSKNPTGLDLAKSIGPGLLKASLGLLVGKDSEVKDIRCELQDGDQVEILTSSHPKALEVIRHSSAHVLAQATQEIYPDIKVTIGPVTSEGFYYDFDTSKAFTDEDLVKIEKKMKEILKKKYPLIREVWSSQKACEFFEKKGELLKKEIIRDLGEKEVSIYKQGEWLDLCRGPHVQNLGQIGAIKLLSHSGSYWRGDSKGKKLQRIYGTAFFTEKELKAFLKKKEEAKAYDHRVLGRKLDLFWFSEKSPGSPFFTGKGTLVYRKLQSFLTDEYKNFGYEEVISPQIYQSSVFKKSGHLDHYLENMYALFDEGSQEDYFLKPMNCPGHCLFYKKDRKSYRDLPWRVADFGRLHRKEASGAFHGLSRVKSFSQDDAHIFCRMDQLGSEIEQGVKMLKKVYETLGLYDFEIELSTRPEKRMGKEELWDKAEEALSQALKRMKIPFEISPGEGAFYGPKLDIKLRDAFDRSWQLGTFQCDFNLPEAFDLSYVREDDRMERPVLIHRALLGSFERFLSVYLEHSKGRLPFWLCPLQVVLLPLSDKEIDFSESLKKELESEGISCRIDSRNEKLSYKIRSAQNEQIPYMLTLGPKEMTKKVLSVRLRTGEVVEVSREDFLQKIKQEKEEKSLQSFLTRS